MAEQLATGFYPFWFWNDRLEADEIRRQIKEMANQGIKGFYIHSRQGLQQPYLSESFFSQVDVAIEAAKEHGLTVCLYDEYPYPSGVAGGEVIAGNPQFYATSLKQIQFTATGGCLRRVLPEGKVLAAKAYPVKNKQIDFSQEIDLKAYIGMVLTEDSYVETGLTAYNRKRYFASEPRPVIEIDLPAGDYEVYVSLQREVTHHKYWNHFVDALNPQAIAEFINLTHERYYQRYANEFGNPIAAIFVDEISAGWSSLVPAAFIERYGYDLCESMTALQEPAHPQHSQVKYDYNALIYDMFCDAFEKPISKWCHEHGIEYCGEKPAMRFSQLKYMDMPGSDNGHKKAGAGLDLFQPRIRTNPRIVASAVYFYDKPRGLCECYHSLGWSGTLQDAKMIADALLISGITHLVPHGFFYSTHALKKHDAPPSFFFQMPYWPLFSNLSDYIDVLGDLFADSYIDARVLVVDPHSGIPNRGQLKTYQRLLEQLAAHHIDYHICDTDVLYNGTVSEGRLKIKDLTIDLVIVPPMEVIEQPLQSWLEMYQGNNGNVISFMQEEELAQAIATILEIVQPSLSVSDGKQELSDVYSVCRKKDGRSFWFVLNAGNQELEAIFTANSPLQEEQITQVAGPHKLQYKAGSYQRTIAPYESLVLVESEQPEQCDSEPIITVPLTSKAKIKLHNKNLVRLADWEMSLLDEAGNRMQTALVPAVPLSNQLEIGKFEYTPQQQQFFGHVPEFHFPQLSLVYETNFELSYNTPVELVIEPGSICGEWQIVINDRFVIKEHDFTPSSTHVYGSLGIDVSQMLKAGDNHIAIYVAADKPNHGLINCLYLAGTFGVSLAPVGITKPIQTGEFEAYVSNGLPFYTGVIEYETEFSLASIPDTEYVYLAPDCGREFNEVAEIAVNDSEFMPVLWQPRVIRIATKTLRKGTNTMHIKVYTTLIRAFEGTYFDEQSHSYRRLSADEQ